MRTLGNKLVIQQDGLPSRTASGLYINVFGENRQNRPNSGVVEAVGEEVKAVKIGDRVLFTNFSGVYFKDTEDNEKIVLTEGEALMVIKNKNLDINSNFDPQQMYNALKGLGRE